MSEQKEQEHGIKLISMQNGKFIFAEKLSGVPTSGALLAALKRSGVVDGILPACFSLLTRNDVLQIPVARAYYQDEPPVFDSYFGIESFEHEILMSILEGKPFKSFEDKYLVKRNTTLLTIKETFAKVLKFPDGHQQREGKINSNHFTIFCGKNTTVYENAIISLIDGSAHQTKDGRVFVYPVFTVRGVGEIHGKVDEEIAIKVTQDIHSHSYLESPSNIFVIGAIHSSFIKTDGNIQALEGIDNTKEVESSRIHARGKVITAFIRKYRVHAKDKVLVSEGIHDSLVISHDEVWSNFIESSEVRCRNGLITNHIRGKSRIFLGPSYVKDDELDFFRNQIQLSEKKLKAQEFVINDIEDRLEKEKQTLLGYFLRLKEAGKQHIILDSSIIRLFESLKLTFEGFKQEVFNYQKYLDEYIANKSYLTFCQRKLNNRKPSFIKVLGRIEPGVIIATPAHVVKVSKPLDHILITMDPITGRLRFTNDFQEMHPVEADDSLLQSCYDAESMVNI